MRTMSSAPSRLRFIGHFPTTRLLGPRDTSRRPQRNAPVRSAERWILPAERLVRPCGRVSAVGCGHRAKWQTNPRAVHEWIGSRDIVRGSEMRRPDFAGRGATVAWGGATVPAPVNRAFLPEAPHAS